MKKPPVTPENASALQEYYNKLIPSRRASKVGFWAMKVGFPVQPRFIGDAEKQVQEHMQKGGVFIVAANHQHLNDQFIVASAARRSETMQPLVGNTTIPAKRSLFKNRFLRFGVEAMGSIPIIRKKDTGGDSTQEDSRKDANTLMTNILVDRMVHGGNVAIFPEGTRGEDDQERDVTKIRKLHRGLGDIALSAAAEGADILVVPMGISYEHSYRKPEVAIGETIPISADMEVEALLNEVQEGMQEALDYANAA